MQENPILVQKKGNKWELSTHKVTFIDQNTENNEVYTSDIDWYEKFAEMHSNFSLVEVSEVVYTAEQLERLEEVKEMNLADTIINNYVIYGVAGEGLETLTLQKDNRQLGIEISEREIQEIVQGQQISELEIQILQLQGGSM